MEYQITNKLSIGVRTVPDNTWSWFKLEYIKYHDQLLAIQWDKDGSKYNNGKGLHVWAGKKLLGKNEKLGELVEEVP